MRTILLLMIGLSSFVIADFTRDDNGIITDSTTNLEWQDNSISVTMTWQRAIDYCEALSLGTYKDWRLPNLNELTSLVDDTKYKPSIDDVFQNTIFSYYWSSTTVRNNSEVAWLVAFDSGFQGFDNNKDDNYYVRCVRAGQ